MPIGVLSNGDSVDDRGKRLIEERRRSSEEPRNEDCAAGTGRGAGPTEIVRRHGTGRPLADERARPPRARGDALRERRFDDDGRPVAGPGARDPARERRALLPARAQGGQRLAIGIDVEDPSAVSEEVIVAYRRRGSAHYSTLSTPSRPGALTLDIPAELTASPSSYQLELYARARHRSGATLRREGTPEHPLVVHGVQRIMHPPVSLPAWPSGARGTRLVLITLDVDESEVRRMFRAIAGRPSIDQPDRAALFDNPLSIAGLGR